MPKRVTAAEILADRRERLDRHFLGVEPEAFFHLKRTFKSLTRFTRTGVANPRFVERFVDDFEAFALWSLANGFALNKELELGAPVVREGTRLVVERDDRWIDHKLVFDRVYELFSVDDDPHLEIRPEHWVTDFPDMRWVKQDDLARRKKKPNLTSYGEQRLKSRRRPLKLSCFGQTKSAAQWAQDERCSVSDKVIAKRKAEGWLDRDAIILPRGTAKP